MRKDFKIIAYRSICPQRNEDKLVHHNKLQDKDFEYNDDKSLWEEANKEVAKMQKKTQNKGWYYFYENYQINNKTIFHINNNSPESIYNTQNCTININCVVGKNGSGKTTIIEMIEKIINNYIFITEGQNYKIHNDKYTYIMYIENVFGEVCIQRDNEFYIISCKGRTFEIIPLEFNSNNSNIIPINVKVNNTINIGNNSKEENELYYNCIKTDNSTTSNIDFFNLYINFSTYFNKNHRIVILNDYLNQFKIGVSKTKLEGSYISQLSTLTAFHNLRLIDDNDYKISCKILVANEQYKNFARGDRIEITNTRQERTLLEESMYFECNVKDEYVFPLRYINKDSHIIGFKLKSYELLKIPTIEITDYYKSNTIKAAKIVFDKLCDKYEIIYNSGIIISKTETKIKNYIIDRIANKMTNSYIKDFQKSVNSKLGRKVAKKFMDSVNSTNFENKHIDILLKMNNVSYNTKDTLSKKRKRWIQFCNENYLNLNTETLNYIYINMTIEDYKYVFNIVEEDFVSYAEQHIYDVKSIEIPQYMKLLKLLSLGIDLFYSKKGLNEPIILNEEFKLKKDLNKKTILKYQGHTFFVNNNNELFSLSGEPIINNELGTIKIKDLLPFEYIKDFEILVEDNSTNNKRLFGGFSSGEMQLINIKSNMLYYLIHIDALKKYEYINIIFDEVELYLHPEWQRRFIYNITDGINLIHFNHIKAINITIATHSPFILSDVPRSNTLFLDQDGNKCEVRSETFGANIHDLLKDGFFMESTIGEVARREIQKIVDFYYEVQDDNKKPVNERNADLEKRKAENKEHFEYIGSIIGDQYYKNTINFMLDEIYDRKKNDKLDDFLKGLSEEEKKALKEKLDKDKE